MQTPLPTRASRPGAALARVPPASRWAVLALALVGAACTDRTGAHGLAVGDPAPDVRFVAIDGSRPALRGLARATLVSFWATDCRICLAEAPELVALRERLAPRGFELVSVAMPHDRPDLVLEHVGASGWEHPVALDVDGATLAAFEPVPGTPSAVLVGPDATVLARWSGPADLGALEARLDALLPPASADSPATAG